MSGALFVIAACFCWGLVFAIPKYLAGYNPIEIALGRYLFFGLFSVVFVFVNKRHLLSKSYIVFWKKALGYSIVCTFLSYTGLVACIKYANSASAALIFGMSPVTISLYGNWFKKEFSYKCFIASGCLMVIGIILSNLDAFHFEGSSWISYIFGLICGFFGLATWTWYAVNNFHMIKESQDLSSNDWVVMMGFVTFFLSLFLAGLYVWLSPDLSKFASFNLDVKQYIVGSALLGIVSSWFAFFLWNCGNKRLPVSMAGQLTVFEMIFGLILVYLVEARWPSLMEILGIGFMLIGVMAAFRMLKKVSPVKVPEETF